MKSRYAVAKATGTPVSSLYYRKKLPEKDRVLKIRIEEALKYHPSYGHRRLALHLGVNKKRIIRVMKLFGLKPYRRRGKKFRKSDAIKARGYPNLARGLLPSREGMLWAADFTYLPFKKGFVYLATVMDVFTREIVGWNVMTNHGAALTLQAFFNAIAAHGRPKIFHSDNGREYVAKAMVIYEYEQGLQPTIREKQSHFEDFRNRDRALHSFLYDRPIPVSDAAMLVRSAGAVTILALALVVGVASFAGNVALFYLFGFGWLVTCLFATGATALPLAVGHLAYEKIIAASRTLQVALILVTAALTIAALIELGQARRIAVDRATSPQATSSYVDDASANTGTADDPPRTSQEPESKAHATLGGGMFTMLIAADLMLGFLAGLLLHLQSDEDYAAWHELKKIREELMRLEKALAELAATIEIVKVRCMAGILRAESVLRRRRPPYYKALAAFIIVAAFLSIGFASHPLFAQSIDRQEAILIDTSGSIGRGNPGNELFREYLTSTRRLLLTEPASSRVWVLSISTDSFGGAHEVVKGWTPESHGVFTDELDRARRELARSFIEKSSDMKPIANGTDIIGALWRVKGLMESGENRDNEHEVKKSIWIFSDMMNETPGLPMPMLLANGPRQMLDHVKASGQVVPLRGYKIYVAGASPQGLSPQAWSTIKEFWTQYFAAAGAELTSYSAECDIKR